MYKKVKKKYIHDEFLLLYTFFPSTLHSRTHAKVVIIYVEQVCGNISDDCLA